MWLPNAILDQVDQIARFRYISREDCARWNKHRAANELRMFAGYEWISRDNKQSRSGFKSLTVAYRDAYYALIRDTAAPPYRRLRLAKAA